MHTRQKVGRRGEELVAGYLRKQGYIIVGQNISWHHHGEIDIIVAKDEYLVCVEVKTRYNTAVPFHQLVPRSKQKKIIMVARYFIQKYELFDKVIRFDVAFVDMTRQPPAIEHIENAFWG